MKPVQTGFQQLISVGPAIERDFHLLGIHSIAQLAKRNPRKMYDNLCELTGERQDICCLDVFEAAVAQARDPQLPTEQCQWWYWSRKRKAENGRSKK
ncbi:MAG TPA: helix-hairpin-helix domain-containing protein [Candidatus Acidoferrales bacterium]|nr:helix-hairpin-helix domain-containing protein [Candidatus Acidoferrales bacterium]